MIKLPYKPLILIIFLLMISLTGCQCEEPIEEIPHECTPGEQETVIVGCLQPVIYQIKCEECHKVLLEWEGPIQQHIYGDYILPSNIDINGIGYKYKRCTLCNYRYNNVKYANNGYFAHGKLSVDGPDLVNQYGDPVQLYGLSTHGLQWFNRYVTYETFESIQNEFGINVIRLALYTSENGYCTGQPHMKQLLWNTIVNGINYATRLGMYVIVDWHMVGADSVADKNPLTYVAESMEFFDKITSMFKDHDNILYEIMNEPNGSTTWADCKSYARQVIPVIRANDPDAIVLVGNPKWSADLNSVMASPLTEFDNIMYTYHFYANGHRNTTQVVNAYSKGFPVFISEFAFTESSGDGPLDMNSGNNWLKILDDRNISYVAWNISNSNGSSSIHKPGFYDVTNFSDEALKEWGVVIKQIYRKKSGLTSY